MLSFIFVIECDIFEWKRICAGFLSVVLRCIAVGDPVIKRGGWDPINRFNPATFVCLSHVWTSISSITCRGLLCSLSSVKMRGDIGGLVTITV